MKHHAHIIICLVSLTSVGLLSSCRTAYQSNHNTQEQNNLTISDSALRVRTEDSRSQFNLNQTQTGKDWKVKVNFDTSKPADPSTGLHPISDIEIEGSETTVKTLLQKDDTLHLSEEQKRTTDITYIQDKQTEFHKGTDSSVAAGIDSGIKYGLIIGIPAALILLILIYNAKHRQKNPSK